MLDLSEVINQPEKLAIAITFFYSESRLEYLKLMSSEFSELAKEVSIFVITNSN